MSPIIILCTVLLLAYLIDVSARHTRIPSVLLLMLLGWGAQSMASLFHVSLPVLAVVLPYVGMVGLILIVLEGALELEISRDKLPHIFRAFLSALCGIGIVTIGLAWAIQVFAHCTWQAAIANAVPLAVISSAVAIPSVRLFPSAEREFVVYESSMSDIIGVLAFNFTTLNNEFSYSSVLEFGGEFVAMILLSFGASIALAMLLSRINHHVKYLPILLSVVLIYAVSKEVHLPALMFILIFGLFLGNLGRIKELMHLRITALDALDPQIDRFRDFSVEITFLIRAIFFVLFGFVIDVTELVDVSVFAWSAGIVVGVLLVRAVLLRLLRVPVFPLLWIAPRGLITILLFASIPPELRVPMVHNSLVLQAIILFAVVMMFGGLTKSSPDQRTRH